MAYIGNSHITNKVVRQFYTNDSSAFDNYYTLTDAELVRLGKKLGVTESQFELDSSSYIEDTYVQQYLVSWFCMRFCEDNIGINNVAMIEEDKYYRLFLHYKKDVEQMMPNITKQMLISETQEQYEYQVPVGMLIR